eukprot:415477_1
MMQRLKQCFIVIETKILHDKIKQGKQSLIAYLNGLYQKLYVEIIDFQMKKVISNDDTKQMKALFLSKHDSLVMHLKTETDNMHLWIQPHEFIIDGENNDYNEKKRQYWNRLREIKVKWSAMMFNVKYID